MELVLTDVSATGADKSISSLTVTFKSGRLIGLYGESSLLLKDILTAGVKYKGTIMWDQEKVTAKNSSKYFSDVYIVPNDFPQYYHLSVLEYLDLFLEKKQIKWKNKKKKLNDMLKLVGLKEDIFTQLLATLSCSELTLLGICTALIVNPSVIFLQDPFLGLDALFCKRLVKLFQMLKEKKQKIILFYSTNIDVLYQYTDECYLFCDDHCVKSGLTSKIFQDVKLLSEYSIPIPKLVHFTCRVKEDKGIKLFYHRDVRDLIKDIYKHIDFKN